MEKLSFSYWKKTINLKSCQQFNLFNQALAKHVDLISFPGKVMETFRFSSFMTNKENKIM